LQLEEIGEFMKDVTPEHLAAIRRMYDTEATDARLYRMLAERASSNENRLALERIASDEEMHVAMWPCG
jgi:rubrerythrin